MAFVFRWLMRLFLLLLALSLGALGLAWYLAARSLPDYDRDYEVAGLAAPVEIVRNTYNVPHVFGPDDLQSFFGLGFVHAQDRLWQMTMLRRTAQGRLSELFGARTLGTDIFMRQLDLYGLAERSLAAQGERERAILKAYADGVNAWIETVRAEALGRGAPEFFLFSRRIESWSEADSLAILKLMALRQSPQLSGEVLRAQTSLALAGRPERLYDILPGAPGPGALALPAYGQLFPQAPRAPVLAGVARDPLDPVPAFGMAGASNAWAAAPSRTTSGSTLLANDPHMGLSAPVIWMLARLKLQSGDVIGGTIPGIPAVMVGRSERLAWGLTASYLDDLDLFVEKLNPDDAGEYLTPEGYKPFVTRQTVIRVKDAEPVTVTLRWTENGPVIPADRLELASITPPGHVMSLSWTALSPRDRSMTALLRLMRSGNVREAIEAGRDFTAPSQNLILADRESIAFQMIGAMPGRDPGHQSQGRMPAPGWLAVNRWQGVLPYENNPRSIDPLGGLVANTNNKIVDRPFPNHVSYLWGDTQRIERLQKLLVSREVHTRASFVEAQLDQVSFSARALLPLIARELWFAPEPPPDGGPESMRQVALKLLAEWNGEMNEHMPEPLIYAAWMRALNQRLIQDELGPLASRFTNPDPVFLERVFRNVDGAGAWCDVVQSTPRESCAEIARSALDTALLGLAARYGERVESWRWGDAHQAAQDHPVLGRLPLLSWLVNIRQSTSGGDNTLMRGRTSGVGDNPFLNVQAAGYRGVYDMADPESSLFIISTGQSGHFLSRYYDNLARLWRRGEYIPMTLDPALARAGAIGVTRLLPRRGG